MGSGATSLYVFSFTIGVTVPVFSDRLSMRRILWYYWRAAAMCDTFISSPNDQTALADDRSILKSSLKYCDISPQMNSVIPGMHADTWCPQVMVASND